MTTRLLAIPSPRRFLRGLLFSVLVGQMASNLILAGLLILDVIRYTSEPHEVVMSSWMIMVLVSLASIEGALLWMLVERQKP